MIPREHGAYGQIGFPLVAAFAVAGVSAGGLLVAAAELAAFLAHEPASILLGLRGARARREQRGRATRWLVVCAAVGAAAAVGAVVSIDHAARWSLAVPLVPALLLSVALVLGREKSWHGEVTTAIAFSGAAVPIAMAAGADATRAAAIAVPFALLFVASTLAVRVVILRVRGGGDPKATSATRTAALSIAILGPLVLVVLAARGVLPSSVVGAAAPGLLTAAIVALWPPAPARLRALGWTLVGIAVLTTALVITTT